MNPQTQIPSHIRFLIAGIQDRAMDLALLGHTSVHAFLDVTPKYAAFELVTRPGDCAFTDPAKISTKADLLEIVQPSGDPDELQAAMDEAREQLGAMLDHLNALIDEELTS